MFVAEAVGQLVNISIAYFAISSFDKAKWPLLL